jgi:septum formation protein
MMARRIGRERSVYHSAVRLILASASPRRSELLRAAGFDFQVVPAEVDERPLPAEPPDDYVRRVALDKARAVAASMSDAVVLAADTCVVVDDAILGKPVDAADAARMLAMLSGRPHDVLTGVAVIGPAGVRVESADSRVVFADLSAAEIAWYVGSGEPADKAGAYAIQGLASRYVERVEGSYSNVVGLPVAVVYRLLREQGFMGGSAD